MVAQNSNLLTLIVLLPLIGALFNGLIAELFFRHFIGKELPRKLVGLVANITVFMSFVISLMCFLRLKGMPADDRMLTDYAYTWIGVGGLNAKVSFMMDPLSAVMALVVTGVGFLIHFYSLGYIAGDKGYGRYFTYLNLFMFSMLLLVLGDNMLIMFVGWEGVGLCSYLLIGFWFEDSAKAAAGKKAFIVNRIGDFGFILAIMAVFLVFNTTDFRELESMVPLKLGMLNAEVPYVGLRLITVITLALFIGAIGKSAQLPLYVWLPDAMAGPTPVSALIHAATMVTAGVYMVARFHFFYDIAPLSQGVVVFVGALTALFAATIAITQNDIKKVLAYSTVSQLGYMFIAVGVGAYAAGIFHLMTHAFFKACLFLGAGSVIHGMHGEQDIRKMGGLRSHMPYTYWTFLIAAIAIAGIFPFSGFFSKDEILWKAFTFDGFEGPFANLPYIFGIVGAALTAFYMMRLVSLTFLGKSRVSPDVHPHESPWTMTMPLVVLAILAAVGGFVGIPAVLGDKIGVINHFEHWLAPVFETSHAAGNAHHNPLEIPLMVMSVGIAAFSMLIAWYLYTKRTEIAPKVAKALSPLYRLSLNKYYVDEIYDSVVIQPLISISKYGLWKFVDEIIIDGFVNLVGTTFKDGSEHIKKVQTGVVNTYFVWFLFGAVALVMYFVFL